MLQVELNLNLGCSDVMALLKITCGHTLQVVPVGLYGTISTQDFGHTCMQISHKGLGVEG